MSYTSPDSTQAEITDALARCGFVVVDLHGVPQATGDKRLVGLPDLLAIQPQGLTLVGDFDPRQVRAAIQTAGVRGVIVLEGAALLVEVKSPNGTLRVEQTAWWLQAGLKPLVLRGWREVMEKMGRKYD